MNEITKDGEVVHLSDFHSNTRELGRAASHTTVTSSSTQQPPEPVAPKSTAQEGDSADKPEKPAADEAPKNDITESDKVALVDLLGQATADELLDFYDRVLQNSKSTQKGPGDITIPSIEDKSQRSRVHGVS